MFIKPFSSWGLLDAPKIVADLLLQSLKVGYAFLQKRFRKRVGAE